MADWGWELRNRGTEFMDGVRNQLQWSLKPIGRRMPITWSRVGTNRKPGNRHVQSRRANHDTVCRSRVCVNQSDSYDDSHVTTLKPLRNEKNVHHVTPRKMITMTSFWEVRSKLTFRFFHIFSALFFHFPSTQRIAHQSTVVKLASSKICQQRATRVGWRHQCIEENAGKLKISARSLVVYVIHQ